jgi:hypothetical protein
VELPLNPALGAKLFGVEPFPPPEAHRTKHPNDQFGFVGDFQGMFDAGLCEVIEYLWPETLRGLIADLAKVSNVDICVDGAQKLDEFARAMRG